MTQTQKEELKKIIAQEIEKLQGEIIQIKQLLQPIKKDCSLDNIAHQTLKQDQDIHIKRYQEAEKRVTILMNTYKNIDSESYGVCVECDEDINIERLKLIPESRYCISCMNQHH